MTLDDKPEQVRRAAGFSAHVFTASGGAVALLALYAAIERDFAPPDILVNNAGIIRRAGVLGFSEEDWDAVMRVNPFPSRLCAS